MTQRGDDVTCPLCAQVVTGEEHLESRMCTYATEDEKKAETDSRIDTHLS